MDIWIDKYIAEQLAQQSIIDRICAPFDAAELQELIEEEEIKESEVHFRNSKSI